MLVKNAKRRALEKYQARFLALVFFLLVKKLMRNPTAARRPRIYVFMYKMAREQLKSYWQSAGLRESLVFCTRRRLLRKIYFAFFLFWASTCVINTDQSDCCVSFAFNVNITNLFNELDVIALL